MKSFKEMSYDEVKAEMTKDNSVRSIVKEVVNRFEKTDLCDMANDLDLIIAIHKKYQKKFGFTAS